MPNFVLTINVPATVDRPGVTIAQIMRELVPVIECSIPVKASDSHRDRLYNVTKATYTWS